jgi:hypothetical protein
MCCFGLIDFSKTHQQWFDSIIARFNIYSRKYSITYTQQYKDNSIDIISKWKIQDIKKCKIHL